MIETAAADSRIAATLALCPMIDGPHGRAAPPVGACGQHPQPRLGGSGGAGISVSKKSVEKLARNLPSGELHRYPHDHFGAFLGDAPDLIAGDQIDFLRRPGLLSAVEQDAEGAAAAR